MIESSPTVSRSYAEPVLQGSHTSAAGSVQQKSAATTSHNRSGQQAAPARAAVSSQKAVAAKTQNTPQQVATTNNFEWGRALVGAAIGAVGGAIVGGIIGGAVGGVPGALIGAGIGAVVGGIAGGLIGGLTGGAPAPAAVAPATATVPAVINAASTPVGMGVNRIPPRVGTTVSVSVTSLPAGGAPVVFSIEGNGGGNGTATINGSPTFTAVGPGTFVLTLSGTTQTSAGSAGKLKLIATQGTTKLASSGGFSISSVPQNWSTALVSAIDEPAGRIGMVARNSWESDSGDITDLDQVKRKEQVEVTTKTGPWATAVQGVSSWKDATMGSIFDNHADGPRASFRVLGSKIANQVFIFKCDRVGVLNITAKNSGLLITRNIVASGVNFSYTISKVGTGVTANGYMSAAASGSAAPPALIV